MWPALHMLLAPKLNHRPFESEISGNIASRRYQLLNSSDFRRATNLTITKEFSCLRNVIFDILQGLRGTIYFANSDIFHHTSKVNIWVNTINVVTVCIDQIKQPKTFRRRILSFLAEQKRLNQKLKLSGREQCKLRNQDKETGVPDGAEKWSSQ